MDRIIEKLQDIVGISGQDEECGDCSTVGRWFALVRRSNRARGGYIYTEDDQGFKDYESYGTEAKLDAAWAEVTAEMQEREGPAEDDYTIEDDARGGYWVGGVGERYDTREEAEQAIRDDAGGNYRPNVWRIPDHGNAEIIKDFDWRE
jgi:hypothetical protein